MPRLFIAATALALGLAALSVPAVPAFAQAAAGRHDGTPRQPPAASKNEPAGEKGNAGPSDTPGARKDATTPEAKGCPYVDRRLDLIV